MFYYIQANIQLNLFSEAGDVAVTQISFFSINAQLFQVGERVEVEASYLIEVSP